MRSSFAPAFPPPRWLRRLASVCSLFAFTFALAADAPDARLSRVESGLLPPARLAGTKSEAWTVAARLKNYHVPGVSLAVLDAGAIAWARGYGIAQAGQETAVTAATLFQAASISKPVAAAGALALVASGQLALDEDVNAKLKNWKVPASPAAEGGPVTLRRLLSHTAGLTVHGFHGYAVDEPRPTLMQVLDGAKPANSAPIRIDLKPGTKWRYSGGGYCVAQQLMLDTVDADFPAFLRERVLAPAGMTASTFEQPLPAALAATAAAGHRPSGAVLAGTSHVYPEMAAAGLWTTPSDLARFVLSLQRSLAGRGGLLPRPLVEAMITPPLAGSGYGLGLGVTGEGDQLQLAHNGANEGFRCALVFYPRTGRGAIVMTNSDNGGPLINEILRAIAAAYDWPHYRVEEKKTVPLATAAFDTLVGRYQHEDALSAVFREDEHFYFQIRGQKRREIFPRTELEFFFLDSPETLAFERDRAGRGLYFVRGTTPPQIFQRVR
ncbi:MAG: beta-lactamase family protein [Verrucomicrobia bacterium]|nr:beta-lactamase family protein [Verrucomicrobiota bacterium]